MAALPSMAHHEQVAAEIDMQAEVLSALRQGPELGVHRVSQGGQPDDPVSLRVGGAAQRVKKRLGECAMPPGWQLLRQLVLL